MKAPVWRAATAVVLGILAQATQAAAVVDAHSYANTDDFRTLHLALDLRADFAQRRLSGHVDLTLDRLEPHAREIVLDTRSLEIQKVELVGTQPSALKYTLGAAAADRVARRAAGSALHHSSDVRDLAAGKRPAVAHADANGRQAALVLVFAIAGYSRAQLDSVAGHPTSAHHLRSPHSYAAAIARGDERRE
jgi:hypothetical protein